MPSPYDCREQRFRMADGVELVGDARGDPEHPPVILLHGGGQTRHAWKQTAERLAERGYLTLAVDQRGHGESGWSPDGDYAIDRFAGDARRLATGFAIRPILIGASLGGVASLLGAGEADRPVAAALVLVDITPRIDPAGRARIVDFMAAHLDRGFASLEEAADAVATYLPHRPRPPRLDGLHKNLRRGDDGRYRWHYDPAFVRNLALRDEPAREARMMAAAQRLAVPVLLVRGAESELVSTATAEEFVAAMPGARSVDVPGAGHMVAGDVNDPFTREVVGFLDGLSSAA
jgi:pimeloyl-ACP methyl ester carboxylesterase